MSFSERSFADKPRIWVLQSVRILRVMELTAVANLKCRDVALMNWLMSNPYPAGLCGDAIKVNRRRAGAKSKGARLRRRVWPVVPLRAIDGTSRNVSGV